jgi:hydroxypyruvate isomerase
MSRPCPSSPAEAHSLSRRRLLQGAVGLAAAGAAPFLHAAGAEDGKAVVKGRLRQSIAKWCFEKAWDLEKMCQIAVQLGCQSIELVPPKDWPVLKKHGLTCALALSHWFDKGVNNPKYQDMCLSQIREAVDASAAFGCPNVLTFTGFRENISDEDGIRNCVAAYKKVIGQAEKQKVNLCLEMLNTRVAEEMKGHPGYQGDHTEYCMEIINKVGSPRMKLLFDVYHVQIMDGDLVARVRKYAEAIGHVHTAGNPGRGELDDKQEINYPAVMRTLAEVGYRGFVGQEFIPTRDPLEGLRQAVTVCDV